MQNGPAVAALQWTTAGHRPRYTARAVAQPELELSTLSLRRTPLVDGVSASTEVQLVVLLGQTVGQSVPIQEELVLGRGMVELTIHDDGVSRRHAAINHCGDGTYVIRDLGSRNGTFVNGVRVSEAVLTIGDRIAMGGATVLQFLTRDRFEEQRLRAQKLQALGELAGGIAHDFNNLLGVVLANVSHVQGLDNWDEQEVRRVLRDVEIAARRAGELTRDLMMFARTGPRVHEVLSLGAVVENAARLLTSGLPKNISLEVQCAPDMAVRGEASRLAQVFTNIGLNAIAAMPDGGLLRIAAVQCRDLPAEVADQQLMLPAGELAMVTVSDTGVGMDAEIRRRAFDPFFTTKPRGAGTGLGLATALAIARDHGGHIAVNSEPGIGTTVFVFLPLRAGAPKPERHTLDESSPLRGRVLVADDEALVRLAASRVLTQAGLEVIEAADGQQAVQAFTAANGGIDLVLLDLDMPIMDGEAALMRIRAMHPGARVLISTGYVEPARERKLREAGVDGVLDKPYDSLTLLRTVAALLRDDGRRRQ